MIDLSNVFKATVINILGLYCSEVKERLVYYRPLPQAFEFYKYTSELKESREVRSGL